MHLISPGNFANVKFTLRPERAGTDVYASITLSRVSTTIVDDPNPKFVVRCSVDSWTTLEGGEESQPHFGQEEYQPAAIIKNCASITFRMIGARVGATAVINVLYL